MKPRTVFLRSFTAAFSGAVGLQFVCLAVIRRVVGHTNIEFGICYGWGMVLLLWPLLLLTEADDDETLMVKHTTCSDGPATCACGCYCKVPDESTGSMCDCCDPWREQYG